MGGGEVARYLGTYGDDRVTRAVFAAAVPPYLHLTADNPDGGLDDAAVAAFAAGVRGDRVAYVDAFATLSSQPEDGPTSSASPTGGTRPPSPRVPRPREHWIAPRHSP